MVFCMGRIKQRIIKNNAKRFIEEYPGRFGKDFEKNKEALKEIGLIPSKRVLNKIAGYITRLEKNRKF